MHNKNTILIIGATGQVGQAIQQQLPQFAYLDIVLACRNPTKLAHSPYPVVAFDYNDKTSMQQALIGIDSVFMMTGYSIDMLKHSKNFVDIAAKSQVKYIMHLGACGGDDTDVAHWGWHQLIEKYIAASGMAYTHLRPEAFMQNILGYQGDKNLAHGVLYSYFGQARLSWVDVDDIATMALSCFSQADKHHGKTYRLGHDAQSYADIAKIIGEETKQSYRYEAQNAETFWTLAQQTGLELSYMHSIYEHFIAHANLTIPNADATFNHFEQVTGKKPTDIRQFVQKHLADFLYWESKICKIPYFMH